MIGNILCWIFAISLMLTKSSNLDDLYTRTLLAMGFILLGIISKAVDYYRDIHDDKHKNKTTTI